MTATPQADRNSVRSIYQTGSHQMGFGWTINSGECMPWTFDVCMLPHAQHHGFDWCATSVARFYFNKTYPYHNLLQRWKKYISKRNTKWSEFDVHYDEHWSIHVATNLTWFASFLFEFIWYISTVFRNRCQQFAQASYVNIKWLDMKNIC